MKYTMGELAKKTEVTSRTIRYWIAEQLIDGPQGQGKGSFYTEKHVEAILRVKELKEDRGMTSAAIKIDQGFPEDQTVALRTRRLTHLSPFPGVDLLIDDGVSPQHKRLFIKAVLDAAKTLPTDKGENR